MKKFLFTLIGCIFACLGCKDYSKSKANSEFEPKFGEAKLPEAGNSIGLAEIKIIPIEHATAIVEWGDITIYVDPVGGAKAFQDQRPPDLILITHLHGDHLSIETLEELDTSRAKIMVPQAVADKIPTEFTPQIDVLNNGESKERFTVNVEAIPMYNLREEALKLHPKGLGNGYVLNMGGVRLYFSGDTEDIPEMRALKNIDKAFICMNLPYTMTVQSAAEAVLEFQPKQVYPYHYRGRPKVSDVVEFKKLINKGNPGIEVVQLDWYPTADY